MSEPQGIMVGTAYETTDDEGYKLIIERYSDGDVRVEVGAPDYRCLAVVLRPDQARELVAALLAEEPADD